VTNRRKPTQRPTNAAWKPTRPRRELFTAIGAGAGVVVVTMLLIFVMKPADTSTPDTSVPGITTPTQSSDSTPTLPPTSTTLPALSTTTASQP
jgi:hypothetical protein